VSQAGHILAKCFHQSGLRPDPPFIILSDSQPTTGRTTESGQRFSLIPAESSGSTAVATVELGGGRRFVGCESDLRLVKAAHSRMAQALKERSKAVPAAKAVFGRLMALSGHETIPKSVRFG